MLLRTFIFYFYFAQMKCFSGLLDLNGESPNNFIYELKGTLVLHKCLEFFVRLKNCQCKVKRVKHTLIIWTKRGLPPFMGPQQLAYCSFNTTVCGFKIKYNQTDV